MKARTKSEVAARLARVAGLFELLAVPTRALLLLELGEGPRGTTALAAAAGSSQPTVSTRLTVLRLAGLVESTPTGSRREHALTPTGRMLAEAIKRLSAV